MDEGRAAGGSKRCVVCGLGLEGQPRVRDAKGNYVCKRFAETRERCGGGANTPAPAQAAAAGVAEDEGFLSVDDPLSGLEQLAAAEAEAEGVHAPIALEPVEMAGRSCPVCARSMAPESVSCAGCGFRWDAGIKSSLLLKKTPGEHGMTVVCPKCKYDMGAGASVLCTECGARAPLQTARESERARSAATARDAYLRPLITFVACIAVMLVATWVTGSVGGLIFYGIGYGATLILGWLVYTALCIVMLGFDAPQHLIVLRLAAVYAASDVAFFVAGFIPIPLLPWIFAVLTYISLLMHFLECEMSEAMILIVCTFAAKVLVVVLLMAWLIGMLG